jgi:hypothetical protein
LKFFRSISLLFLLLLAFGRPLSYGRDGVNALYFNFYGDSIHVELSGWQTVDFKGTATDASVQAFYDEVNSRNYAPAIKALLTYKEQYKLNDWLYYQLIRKTAQQFSPKAENYQRYTLYKWFLLAKSGYDARLAIAKDELLFYVRSDENVYDIPFYLQDGKQYVCLNIHDYAKTDLNKNNLTAVNVKVPEGEKAFSYKVTQLPEFTADEYQQKDIQFTYKNKPYHFKVMLNSEVQHIFTNYPVVDYESYFNIPLSHQTYNSLIPELKEILKDMKQKKGVDYLMRFTRNAFLYENDQDNFGKEKRLSPEQTLFTQYSDCDDRAALFFYLVKEVYNLPMIVLLYPTHVTIAVKFDKPEGQSIVYKDKQYSVCEPTPQAEDLQIGQLAPKLRDMPYEVAYEYNP